jgi:hypothetical protein
MATIQCLKPLGAIDGLAVDAMFADVESTIGERIVLIKDMTLYPPPKTNESCRRYGRKVALARRNDGARKILISYRELREGTKKKTKIVVEGTSPNRQHQGLLPRLQTLCVKDV